MMAKWSTDTVKAGEGFSFWHDIVGQAVLNVSTEPRPEQFQAWISWRVVGGMRFTNFNSTGHALVRSRRLASQEPAADYLIGWQRQGQSEITQSGEAFTLNPGEIAIVDGQQPFRMVFPGPVSRVLAVMPRQILDQRAPWLRRAARRSILGDAPFFSLVLDHLRQLADDRQELSDLAATLLAENLCNLIALTTAPDLTASSCSAELQLTAILSFCRQNLGDDQLSPAMVATRFGISVRTVHVRFAGSGQSFGRWLTETRLTASRLALKDPNQRNRTISEIAYRMGFSDLSYFSRAFRSRYDLSPREWRQSTRQKC